MIETAMEAILGKITGVSALGGGRFRVACVPACLLPARSLPPAWLHGVEMTIEREASDPRELGGPGDSVALTPAESARWLRPLAVEPAVSYGQAPARLRVRLGWWPGEAPPVCLAEADGRQVRSDFVRDGDGWLAEIDATPLHPLAPPADITVTCGELSARSAILPAGTPFAHRVALPDGEAYRLENRWYCLDVIARTGGGAILAWRERGRALDHFARPGDRIGDPLAVAGQMDWFRLGWEPSGKLRTTVLPKAIIRQRSDAVMLALAGRVNRVLTTRLECVLPDDLPLVCWRRTFRVANTRDRADRPREPIDALRSLGCGFRGAWPADVDGARCSRILCSDGEQLVSTRLVAYHQQETGQGWRMAGGWTLVEHPWRRACLLYLFPPHPAPMLMARLEAMTLVLEPAWPMAPVRAGDTAALSLAMTAGECAGAGASGAWAGCRAPLPGGGVRCAAVARLPADADRTAVFMLGGERREAPLQCRELPDVGAVYWAVAEFPAAAADAPLEIAVAGLPQRRWA